MKTANLPIYFLAMITTPTKLHSLLRAALILLAIGAIGRMPAMGPAIGMAVADGGIQIDHSRVWGNTTLFDGSLIETSTAPSRLRWNSGVEIRLSADTRAIVYQRRLVLEAGYGQLESAADFEVEARSLRISAATRESVARIKLEGGRKVIVAAVRGSVQVRNASGLLVANVDAGRSLDLEPQVAGAAAPTRVSGCLLSKSGKIILVEQTTNVVLELEGPGLDKEIGNHVEISGAPLNQPPSVPDASQLIRVAALKQVSKGGCSTTARKVGAVAVAASGAAASGGAAGTGAAGAAGAASAGGIGVATIAVVGGVAVAATVGGLAAVGDLPGQGGSQPSASR